MPGEMVVQLEKPVPRISLSDWETRLKQVCNIAEKRQQDASYLRHTSRTLRNETNIDTTWSNFNTNLALEDRLGEMRRWRTAITNTVTRLENEMNALRSEKALAENELEGMQAPMKILSECLSMRDDRLDSDLAYDEAEAELKKELCVLENNTKTLRDQCQQAFEKLNRLEDAKFRLYTEIDNKIDAENCDVSQLELDKYSANITFKTDPTRNPRNYCTYQAWAEHTEMIKQLADNEVADTYAIRESLFVVRERAKNILRAQQDRTDHIMRKRIFQIQKAKNELEWQAQKTRTEMEKLVCEITALEISLRDKSDAQKLVETRLENRAQRSGMELCLDEAHDKLLGECQSLRNIRKTLSDKMDCAKTLYTALEQHLIRITTDLQNKQHALMIDIRALDMRAKLQYYIPNCFDGKTQTDRNINLTQMENEIPKT